MVSSPAGVNPTKIVRPRAETGFTIHLHQKAQPWTRFGLLPLGPRSRPPHVMVTAGSGSARSPRPAPSALGFRRDFRGQLLRGLRRDRPSGHALAPVPVTPQATAINVVIAPAKSLPDMAAIEFADRIPAAMPP